MSRTVYIDGRAMQLMDCHRIIDSAVNELNARRSEVNCGHADVVRSHIDVTDAVKAFEAARYQDKMEVRDTNELQDKLLKDRPDYSVETLGDWRPDVSVPPIKVEEDSIVVSEGRRLMKMLDVPALDDPGAGVVGATISVFEVDDGGGGTSYEIGLDSVLFDEDGAWKSARAKTVWEGFLANRLAEEKEARGSEEPDGPGKAAAAMRVAGLNQKRKERVPGGRTHTVFGSGQEVTTTMPAAKKFRVGE